MQVTPFANTAPTAGNTNPTKSGSLGDPTSLFISMLSAELKSQDPTSPLDPSQMVQQIVSISQLDQLIQINQGLQGVEAAPTTQGS